MRSRPWNPTSSDQKSPQCVGAVLPLPGQVAECWVTQLVASLGLLHEGQEISSVSEFGFHEYLSSIANLSEGVFAVCGCTLKLILNILI